MTDFCELRGHLYVDVKQTLRIEAATSHLGAEGRWPNAGNWGLRAYKVRQGKVGVCPFTGWRRDPLLARAQSATCRSVARRESREKRRVRGEPAGYELGEEPHALGLACLPLCEKPNRSVHVQVGARRPREQGVGIPDEARQGRHPEPLP